jgi:bifunctional UDP-N-acetylglucosamine pyrophosphorylase / glucosamine-1-phosphate N-acetyltransferase
MPLSIIILAAGQGKRMHSDLPKVLQPLGGMTLLEHVVQSASALKPEAIHVVYGHGGDQVRTALKHLPVRWVLQAEQLGTGHAVIQALPAIPDEHLVLILYGDVPLVRRETLQKLVDSARRGELALLTAHLKDSSGYGRVLRDVEGQVSGIVEHKDANQEQRRVSEINAGLMACRAALLRGWLANLRNNNVQKEYYLPDVIAMAVAHGLAVEGIQPVDESEVAGINDRQQLAIAETILRGRIADGLMQQGVTLRDPARIDVRGQLQCGRDVVIDVNCVFEGHVKLGNRVHIGANVSLRDCEVGDDTQIFANSLLDGARIGARVRIGPFARIRPESRLADGVHVGNFVEVKNSRIGDGSKANHLSYLGDSEIGRGVNIGAGTITCNYDGVNKYRTVIGDDAFIGSNSSLVAPVTVGPGATIGAGSVITREAPADTLSVARAEQKAIVDWKRPKKQP